MHKKSKVVVAAGTFDILHLGHLHYLNHARLLGDRLVVIVSTDKIAKKYGKSLVHNEKERLEMIRSLRVVDEAVLGNERDMLAPIRKIRPDVIFIGYDQRVPDRLLDYCKKNGIHVVYDECSKMPDKYKTTIIKERIAGSRKSERLLNLAKTNVKLCPWCGEKKPEEYVNELVGEVDEVKSAIEKKDYENLSEEIGDVIWDALVLAHICEKEGLFKGDDVLEKIIRKIERRKPWLIKGKKVSKEEAVRIWENAKRMEKIIKHL
ncbi:MAG: MazG nucleotide pyrophosphohydrolase domain-containing protein [Candidatus Micrarchaeia archaeon]